MKKILLIQGSLKKEGSKTSIGISTLAEDLKTRGAHPEILDLRDLDMPLCDGRDPKTYGEDMRMAAAKIEAADLLVFGMPVYCYSVSGPLKNFIDITAGAMGNKTAAILCNAGGPNSYLASADLAKILAFEANVRVVQPTVYTWYMSFDGDKIVDQKVLEKIDELAEVLVEQ